AAVVTIAKGRSALAEPLAVYIGPVSARQSTDGKTPSHHHELGMQAGELGRAEDELGAVAPTDPNADRVEVDRPRGLLPFRRISELPENRTGEVHFKRAGNDTAHWRTSRNW